ncbi:PIG-L deacetylase family protein [Amycolatopsis sp. DSM 110486]|uniref:PIG-L deacetylase family protein n=1 Tax=Amycolatopsis sp. DSM 110486 TaxID=2865832 RepID=UPI001C6A7BC7|nr:PIG-L deacetylase family protein [Amycolatopsis sp. DSM 110486]QYN21141.1 PIG-L family deacetylase [Amycolatopsis sp. DSM 110486]
MTEPLVPLDESWSTALAFAAHPDDLEYGTASAVARWTSQGKRVVYCLATSGEAGIDAIDPAVAGPLREAEERAGAAAVGVDLVEFLGHPDGVLEYGLPLRRDIARAIRRHRPDVVVTGNYHDRWGPGAPNQADHIALGRAVLDGARDAGNRWVFRELLDEGLDPWQVRRIVVTHSPESTHGVDTTDFLDQGVASLEAHAEYLRGIGPGDMASPREFLESSGAETGLRLGVRFAVPAEVIVL